MERSSQGPSMRIDDDTYLLVLTGAGVSKESGIPTFRDADGLWEQHRVEDVASPEGFQKDPLLVWRFYSQRRANMKGCLPNPGHHALAEIEARLGDRFLLATQNIDGLHQAAGSQRVVELHGNLFQTRCSVCDRAPFQDDAVYENKVPVCGQCHAKGEFSVLRPHIVWFGEYLDPADLDRVERFMQQASRHRFIFLAAGTSGVVYPAAGFVEAARRHGADTWLVNFEVPDNADRFRQMLQGPSGALLPTLFGT